MKKFRFSLETVLRVKRQVEELRQRELAAAQAQRDKVFAQLGAFQAQLTALNEAQAGRPQRQHRPGRRGLVPGQPPGPEQQHHRRQARLSAAKEELLDAARQRAVEAARERKVLEKLEEQQRLQHQLKSNREEQGFMDEMAQHALSAMAYASPSAPAD